MTQSIGAMRTHTHHTHMHPCTQIHIVYSNYAYQKRHCMCLKSHPSDRHEMETIQSYMAIDITIYKSDFRLSILQGVFPHSSWIERERDYRISIHQTVIRNLSIIPCLLQKEFGQEMKFKLFPLLPMYVVDKQRQVLRLIFVSLALPWR